MNPSTISPLLVSYTTFRMYHDGRTFSFTLINTFFSCCLITDAACSDALHEMIHKKTQLHCEWRVTWPWSLSFGEQAVTSFDSDLTYGKTSSPEETHITCNTPQTHKSQYLARQRTAERSKFIGTYFSYLFLDWIFDMAMHEWKRDKNWHEGWKGSTLQTCDSFP